MNYIQVFVKAHTEARLGVSRIEKILQDLDPGPEKTTLSAELGVLETRMLDLGAFGQELECNKAVWLTSVASKSRKRKYGE